VPVACTAELPGSAVAPMAGASAAEALAERTWPPKPWRRRLEKC